MASFDVNTYSAEQVVLTIAGFPIEGWQTISIARRTPTFTPIYGIRGKHSRARSSDRSANLVLPILQTQSVNDILSTIHAMDEERGTGRLSFTLKDNSGSTIISSSCAYITSYPETIFSGDFEYRVWNIFCEETDTFIVGGNTKPQKSIFDSAINEVSSFISGIF